MKISNFFKTFSSNKFDELSFLLKDMESTKNEIKKESKRNFKLNETTTNEYFFMFLSCK